MTNIDRLDDLLFKIGTGTGGGYAELIDVAADVVSEVRRETTPQLLMPDLPEPTIWRSGKEPRWIACDTEIEPAGYEQRVLVHNVDISWDLSLNDAKNLAYALLAAANYAERNQA